MPFIKLLEDESSESESQQDREEMSKSVDDAGEVPEVSQTKSETGEGVDTLYQCAEELQSATDEGLSAIEELKSTMESIAAAAEESAGAAEESLGAVKTIKQNSSSILEASRKGVESIEELERSTLSTSQKITESSENMLRIAKSAEDVHAVGERLHKAGEEVSQTVTLITKLAKRTSLLALNAAIEASRAKEKGRGFSVIAKEIRSLSAKSNLYAQEIDTTVQNIQTHVGEIRESVLVTKESIEKASTEAQQNAKNMHELVQVLLDMTDNVKNSLESFASLDEIIAKMQLSSETIASAAEESAGAVSEVTQTISMQVTAFKQSDSAAKLLEKMALKLRQASGKETIQEVINEVASAAEELSAAIEEIVNSMEQSVAALSQIKEAATISKEDASVNADLTKQANAIALSIKKDVETIKEQIALVKEEFRKSTRSVQQAGVESKTNLQRTEEVLHRAKEMKGGIKHLRKILRKIELTNVQTASLSINGSVEGMQLKEDAQKYAEGFLAVSNDIRNLAQNSEESLDRIDDIVDNLEEETENIIEALYTMRREGVLEADSIIALSAVMERNAEKIEENVRIFENVGSRLAQIASALQEAQVGAEQTQTAAELTRKNVQESEIAAEHIHAITGTMTDRVGELIEISAMMKDL